MQEPCQLESAGMVPRKEGEGVQFILQNRTLGCITLILSAIYLTYYTMLLSIISTILFLLLSLITYYLYKTVYLIRLYKEVRKEEIKAEVRREISQNFKNYTNL